MYDVNCGFVIYDLYHVEVDSLYAPSLERFCHKWVLNFVKKHFMPQLRWSYGFYSVWYITLIDADIEKSLQPLDKSQVIMLYDPFSVLLDSIS